MGASVKSAPRVRPEVVTDARLEALYRVIVHNDDVTPMDFVVHVLMQFFGMDEEKATQVMLHVHTRGVGICGVFSKDVAETRVEQVNVHARQHQHPLQCVMEET